MPVKTTFACSSPGPGLVPANERQDLNFSPPRRNLITGETRPTVNDDRRMTDQTERIYERLLVRPRQAGDEAAFAELVERFSPRLRYFLRKLLASADSDAEDALQDVWLDVFRYLPRLADPQALRRLAVPHRSRPRRSAACEKQSDWSSRSTKRRRMATRLRKRFSAEDAAGSMRRSTAAAEQREVLVLRFLEEMSYEEIARVTGCQLGTVRSRIHYAKQALRKAWMKIAGANLPRCIAKQTSIAYHRDQVWSRLIEGNFHERKRTRPSPVGPRC